MKDNDKKKAEQIYQTSQDKAEEMRKRIGKSLGYANEPCPLCGKYRVERYENGEEVCSKCEWNITLSKQEYFGI